MGRDHYSEPLGGIDKKLSTKKGAAMGALFFALQLFCAMRLYFQAMCDFRHGDLSHLLRDRLALT